MQRSLPIVAAWVDGALRQSDGSLLINAGYQLVVYGACSADAGIVLAMAPAANSNYHATGSNVTTTDVNSAVPYAKILTWKLSPAISEDLLEVTDVFTSGGGQMQQRLLIAAGSGAFTAAQYEVKLECTDSVGEIASSSAQVLINSQPVGAGCSACRLVNA